MTIDKNGKGSGTITGWVQLGQLSELLKVELVFGMVVALVERELQPLTRSSSDIECSV